MYLVGIHGAGLCLSIFMSYGSILQEVLPWKTISVITMMSALSGHITYSDLIRSKENKKTNILFKPEIFAKSVLNHMLENNFF